MSFEEKITLDIEERKSTMSEIEKTIFTKRYALSQKHKGIFAHYSIGMIYAIWEGFVQKSFRIFIEEINTKNVLFKDFIPTIKIFHIENTHKQFNQLPEKNERKIEFYDKLSIFFTENYHNLHTNINTGSNVGFDTLNMIMQTFGLGIFTEYWGIYQHPTSLKSMITTFLRYRNAISHGGDVSNEEIITQEIFSKYKKMVSNLMDEIQDRMQNAINEETYKT